MAATRRRRRTGGAAEAVFSPTDIAGLQLWLDANDASTLFTDAAGTIAAGDGDVVGHWADKSGVGNHFIQATTARKPTLQFNIQNGLPIVRGDAADDVLTKTLASLTNETIFAVVKRAVNNTEGTVFGVGVASRLMFTTNANEIEYRYNSNPNTLSAGFTEIAFNVFRASYNGTRSAIAVNGGGASTSVVAAAGHQYSAIFANFAGSRELNGDMGELLVYDTELSVANLALVDDYTKSKWGTP